MSFLAPLAFILSALIPLIVLLYFLRLRRPELEISSTYLWRRVIRDLRADAPWQKLRPNILLLLQVLFLVTLIIALARPFSWKEGISSASTIIILDTSASMAATDILPNRIEAAKDQAHRLIDDLPTDGILTIIQAGDQAKVLISNSTDRRFAHMVIDNIHSISTNSAMEIALQIAAAIASRQQDAQIIILSDGGVQISEYFVPKSNVVIYPIGQRGENQAISQLTLDIAPSGNPNAFVQISNYGELVADRRILMYANGNLIHASDLQIQPGETGAITLNDLPEDIRQIEAVLSTDPLNGIAINDDLPLDDHAYAVLPQQNPVKITLVTNGNRFLETAIKLIPKAIVTKVDPNDDGNFPESDLTVIDGKIPLTSTFPSGNLLFIGPLVSTEFFTITGKLENPVPTMVSLDDPIVGNLNLDTINILDAAWIDLPDWAKPNIVAESENYSNYDSPPLLFSGQYDGRKIAVITFDLHRSDLPLQVAFPILFANLTNWLLPELGGGFPRQVSLNQPVILSILPGMGDKVSITLPDGRRSTLPIENGEVTFTETNQLGIYQIEWLTESPVPPESEPNQLSFTVNLFSPQESKTTPISLVIPGTNQLDNVKVTVDLIRREWWRIFAVIAITILMIEWMVYHRATIVQLIRRMKTDLIVRSRVS